MARRVRKPYSTIESSTKPSTANATTGPSAGGLGAQTAICKAKEIILAGRTRAKVTPVIKTIQEAYPKICIFFMELDLTDLSFVRRVAEIIDGSVAVIYLLFNNAGVMAVKDYTKPADSMSCYRMERHTNRD